MCFEVERDGGEEGDVNLSNGVDWMHSFLIAVIQKGGNMKDHVEEECCCSPKFNINPKQRETQE